MRQRRSVRVRCHDSSDGEEAGTWLRVSKLFLEEEFPEIRTGRWGMASCLWWKGVVPAFRKREEGGKQLYAYLSCLDELDRPRGQNR